MDIVGAINYNLRRAGVREYERHDVRNANGQLGCVVGWDIPTRPGIENARLVAHVPYDDVLPRGVGYDEVSGKVGRKIKKGIKKAATKVAKSKIVKGLLRVAKPLSNLVAPGAAAALQGAVKLTKVSTHLVKAAKQGHKGARKLLAAPMLAAPGVPSAALAAPSAPAAAASSSDDGGMEAGPAYDMTADPSEDDGAAEDDGSSDDGVIDAEFEDA